MKVIFYRGKFLLNLILFCFVLFSFTSQLEASSKEPQKEREETERFDIEINSKRNSTPYLLEYVVRDGGQWLAFFQDQSVWILEDCRDEDFIDVASQWQTGDEIRLYPRNPKKKKGDWLLKNLSSSTVFYGHLKTSPNPALQIDRIDTKGYFIQLSDSSYWTIGWLDSWKSWNWKPDTKILVNRGSGGSYILINCDDHDKSWVFATPTNWQ